MEKNEARIADALTPENLDLLFEERFVDAMTRTRTWLHLRLLSHAEVVKKLPYRNGPVDSVIRALMLEPSSPLCVSVAHSYGTKDPPFSPEDDWELLERTVENPSWYIELRADYPLLMVACEALDSGRLDLAYNRNDELYIAHQGRTTRTRCPVFLALKAHVLVLRRAVQAQQDRDFYVSDLYDLFMTVCDHSVYEPAVWRNPRANTEYPTPFVFLMRQILLDLSSLFTECHCHRKDRPGQLGSDIVRIWAFCLIYLAGSKGKVSDEFKIGEFTSFLNDCIDIRPMASGRTHPEEDAWSQLFVDVLSEQIPSGSRERLILQEAADRLNPLKPEVHASDNWLREQLGLPERSEQTP
ncbi:MAG: hypothetical protein JW993_17215 [Sedimentisphaerales bacterium]|nr:hypothetical protein [Sedimentisphaerales bacterium]